MGTLGLQGLFASPEILAGVRVEDLVEVLFAFVVWHYGTGGTLRRTRLWFFSCPARSILRLFYESFLWHWDELCCGTILAKSPCGFLAPVA